MSFSSRTERGARRRVQHVDELLIGARRGPSEQLQVEVATDHRRQGQCALGGFAESHHPAPDHFADAVGEGDLSEGAFGRPVARRVLVERAGLDQVSEHLVHEERVAVGLTVDRVGEPDLVLAEWISGEGLHERDDTGVVESAELQTGDARVPLDITERLAEGACVRELVVAEDAHQQHAHRRLPGHDVIEQHEARIVGPLQVVEHQDDRLLLGDGGEQTDGRREQQEPFRVGVGGVRRRESRQPAGKCRHERA